jgi:hypothetical protein
VTASQQALLALQRSSAPPFDPDALELFAGGNLQLYAGGALELYGTEGNVTVAGSVLVATPSLVDGVPTVIDVLQLNAGGALELYQGGVLELYGAVPSSTTVSGQILTASPALVAGAVSTGPTADTTVSGQTLTVGPALLPGSTSNRLLDVIAGDFLVGVSGEYLTGG